MPGTKLDLCEVLSAALPVAILLGSLPDAAAALELEDVLEASRVSPPARVEFTEERHNPLFDEILVLDGYLEYLDAGVLNKVIETPFREAFLIEDGEVHLQRDGEARSVSLERSRELESIIGAIDAVLSGEAHRLEALFEYEVSGTLANWSIELEPKSRRVARSVQLLTISGNDDAVERIVIELQDGERQIMNISSEAPER